MSLDRPPAWLAPLQRLEARLRSKPSLAHATVTSIDPVQVQIDGKPAPVAPSPATLTPVTVGDRVIVAHHGGTQLTILGRLGGGTGAMLLADVSLPTNDRAATLTIPTPLRGRFQKYVVHIKSGVSNPGAGDVRGVAVRPNGASSGSYRYNAVVRDPTGNVVDSASDDGATVPRSAYLGAFSGLATVTFLPSERSQPSWMYYTAEGWCNTGSDGGRTYQGGGRWAGTGPQTITEFTLLTVLAGANFADNPRAELWGYR